MAKGVNSGEDKGSNNEVPFDEVTEEETEALNRSELMKLTGKELSKLALPYTTLTLKTLERKSKPFLCDIILLKSDTEPKKEEPKARAGRSESGTDTLINGVLGFIEMVKYERDKEPLNANAKEMFKSQLVSYTDDKIANNEMDVNKANNLLLVVTGGAILFDGLYGFKNVPTLLEKIKNKFSKKVVDSGTSSK